ncbi:MAG: hypothetical protein LBV33_03665 [Lachnospiraceae bacterium]|nr:hypothetical protein [Lachnospiraceae bacterium]
MKNVLLSADGQLSVYSVPDTVADNLEDYCIEFCGKWLQTCPDALKYRINGILCYNEDDFVEYLNLWVFPDTPSRLIETLDDVWDISDVPNEYKECEWFNF